MKPINLRKPPTLRKGPVRQSKRVRDRLKAADSLLSAIEQWKDAAAAGFRAKLEAGLRDGETVPDQALALELAGRSVKAAIDALVRADAVYCDHADARKKLDRACNRLAGEIYPELVDVRRAIDTRFGRDAGRRFHGLVGSTRRKPRRLHPQLEGMVIALRASRWNDDCGRRRRTTGEAGRCCGRRRTARSPRRRTVRPAGGRGCSVARPMARSS